MIDKKLIPQIKTGIKVRVYSTLNKEPLSPFEGIVIARKHGNEPGATFTVRSIISGVGVEKVFPIYSPAISKLEIIAKPKKVKRSKLYWIRSASGTKIRKRLGVSI
ncbi:MAG: 50S ribosomal protein L19 [Patescibacteria group bacterium]|nr:50S ribosomal protein L19 [Patescibacteria group bacterium]MCX7589683.1 50S ribosomal protein L19 [Patescibacteria group bacterium]MDW8279797.1 50S ribosomal protein L19 [bacterium]